MVESESHPTKRHVQTAATVSTEVGAESGLTYSAFEAGLPRVTMVPLIYLGDIDTTTVGVSFATYA